ncbi:MAG: acetoin utilization protein [Alphaproteobacteria bacterium RIFCSPHIGHO2_12_FULL_63_12]|nr:MAG: acetoin utilization protein [Alphaproteobacteria bacterium RIFCSPHIGHO2_12_FULL_63_12]
MTTLLFEHEAFGEHETPAGHPERAERYHAASAALRGEAFTELVRRSPPRASRAAIERVHQRSYVDEIEAIAPAEDLVRLDPDTTMGPHSLDAALRAAGGGVAAVDAIYAGEAANAFVLARPPGHHAPPARAMGFCLFNSAAVAAMHARAAYGARRVAVVDFDVHHGNGTEEAFWRDEFAFYASSHEWPQYPGTGRASDRGAFDNIVNAPLAAGSSGEEFRQAWGDRLLPALDAFAPDIIVVSAGFDAHRADPLGGLKLTEPDFDWVTREIIGVAKARCDGRIVSLLEGGYDLDALAASVAAHVAALMRG